MSVTPLPARGNVVRDQFIDFLRVGSLLIVVAGHWLAIVPYISQGVVGGRMLYDVVPAFWAVTWLFQVIPLFFFVGGFANYTVFTRLAAAGRTDEYLRLRLSRLLGPTLVFLGFIVLLEAALDVFDLGGRGPLRGMRIGQMTPFAQLWFLCVYLILVLLAPITIGLHRRLGGWVPAGLVLGVAVVDAASIVTGRPHLLGINIVLVWLIPHQLGYFYADGRLARVSAERLWATAAAALLVLLILSSLPVYGRNLLDNGVTLIGITAPTLPFVAASVALVAAALALRAPISASLRGRLASRLLSSVNAVAMTVFLWHLAAYYGALLILDWLGAPLPATPNLVWWLERPLFVLVPAALLAMLVAALRRFERPEGRRDRLRARRLRQPAGVPPAALP